MRTDCVRLGLESDAEKMKRAVLDYIFHER